MMQEKLEKHFLQKALMEKTVILIDYCNANDQERRKDFWISHLKVHSQL